MRTSESKSNLKESRHSDNVDDALSRTRILAPISQQQQQPAQQQQQKTRKRKGSLRKVALLGRGAQREKRELKPLPIETATTHSQPAQMNGLAGMRTESSGVTLSPSPQESPSFGLGISDVTPRPSMDGYAHRTQMPSHPPPPIPIPDTDTHTTSPSISYTSTTDEEDILSIKSHVPSPLRPGLISLSSGSESYFKPARSPSVSIQRRRSIKHTKSPLSLQGLTASPLPAPEEDHDYSETEWWGWVILIATWTIFVIGMGSCLGVWTWAWDVGTTPYARPEFEDDPTLPVEGYYPSLMILTCIMAWVWVVMAWVGMKYFRHAKISGD
jgi:hypothetical protein